MKTKSYWVYILYCENDTYYTGYTTNLESRFRAHLDGKCKYTRSFKPLLIAQQWQFTTKSCAMRVERYIKRLSRVEKKQLIHEPQRLHNLIEMT